MDDDSRHGLCDAKRYNIILGCLSLKQNINIISLRSKSQGDANLYRVICVCSVSVTFYPGMLNNEFSN